MKAFCTLLYLIVGGEGGGGQIANFLGKNPQVHLIIIREWAKSTTTPHILRNLDNFPARAFYLTPPPPRPPLPPTIKAQKSINKCPL